MIRLPVTLVLLFGFRSAVILTRSLVIVMIAIPLLIQSCDIFAMAYWTDTVWGLPHKLAAPRAMTGTPNFFELAVAVAIGLFGPNPSPRA